MFYLVLPSNSSFAYYPENTVAHYVTRLPQDISISGEWEVGLEEIQYTHNWSSFKEDEAWMAYSEDGGGAILTAIGSRKSLPSGYYAHKGDILEGILDTLAEVKNLRRKLKMTWDPKTNVIFMKVADGFTFTPNAYLRRILGFPETTGNETFGEGTYYSSGKDYLNQSLTALYVYCDIVQPRVVGDSMVSLLRTVPVSGEHGRVVYQSFHNVQYIPLDRYHFHDIEIDIRDDTGQRVPFDGGRVVVTLRFRRKNPF